jgi:ABC-type multidrug transport system fused ATPase/permease subunit
MARPKREISIALSYIRQHKWLSGLNVLVSLGVSASEAFGMGMIIPILQSLIGGADFFVIDYIKTLFAFFHIEYNFLNLTAIFVAIMVIRYALTALQQYLARLLNATVTYQLREKAFQNLIDLPLSYYYKQKIGDITATLHTSSLHSGMVLELIVLTFSAIIISAVYLTINSFISLPLTLLVCLLALFSYFFVLPRFRASFAQGHEAKGLMDGFFSFLVDTLGSIKILKSFSNEGFHVQKFQQLNSALKKNFIQLQVNQIMANLFSQPLTFLFAIGLMVFSVQVLHLPLVLMITFFIVFLRLFPQLRLINSNYLLILQYLSDFAKIEDIIAREDKTYLPDGFREIKTFRSEIEFSHVYFSYPESQEFVLKDVNLRVERNKITALVGASGGGKTTIIDLILRLHDPDKGVIKVDGTALPEFRRSDWHQILGIVHQDPYLFNDTIYNNILYGKLDANSEEIFNAAKLANAHDFILKLPDKYDTIVGERGMILSGGEKQRIAMARALVKNPEILILDEATSALDSESERLIKEAIARVSRSKTIIIIAHRIATIVEADKIIVVEDGEVAEEGTHEELLQKEGVYKENYSLQLLGA